MCGIAGILSQNQKAISSNILLEMGKLVLHRGPDANAHWINNANTVGLIQQYLAPNKKEFQQPSIAYLQQYSIVFDGKIDNITELKNNLSHYGYYFKTNFDAEVVVAAFDLHKEKCIQLMEGVFAFAIWDEKKKNLFFARDRFGQKPFYYSETQDQFSFASEIKALWPTGIQKSADERMLMNYLSFGQVQNPTVKPQTFYKNISSLPPAHYGYYHFQTKTIEIHRYWNINKDYIKQINASDASSILDQLLALSIDKKLNDNVAFAFLLQNNIESAGILSYILDKKRDQQCQLFSNTAELPTAYQQLQNNHSFETVTDDDRHAWINNFKKICYQQDEPFSEVSIHHQFKYYSQVKSAGISTVVDTTGVNEMMFGHAAFIPSFLQEQISRYHFLSSRSNYFKFLENGYEFDWGLKNVWAAYLPAHRAIAIEKGLYKSIYRNKDLHPALLAYLKGCEWEGIHQPIITKLNDQAYFTIFDCGLEEKLRYADRNSMANSLTLRIPFLDAALAKFMFSLPTKYKMKNGITKDLFRQVIAKKLPSELFTQKENANAANSLPKYDTALTEYVQECKRKLVNQNILQSSVLQTKHVDNSILTIKDFRYISSVETLGL